jgi:hypothetical protein
MGGSGSIVPSAGTSMLGGPTLGPPGLNPGPGMGPGGGDIFSSDFINSVASTLDRFEDLDQSLFRPDGDINFERDFGQWFQPDDTGGSIKMD